MGVLEIADIFFGWTADAGPEPTYEENESTPWAYIIRAIVIEKLDLENFDR